MVKRTCGVSDPTDRVVGSVSGRPIEIAFGTTSKNGFPVLQPSWGALLANSAGPVVIGWGESDRDGGVQTNAGGLIALPDEGQPGATFYCASQVEANLTTGNADSAAAVILSNLSELGRCPGTPVSGEVDICFSVNSPSQAHSDSCPSNLHVSGTVEGTGIELGNGGGIIFGRANEPGTPFHVVSTYNDQGAILIDSQPDGSLTGWLRIPNGDATAVGAVYCLGGAQIVNLAGGDSLVSFKQLGSLGPCPGSPVQGELGFCF